MHKTKVVRKIAREGKGGKGESKIKVMEGFDSKGQFNILTISRIAMNMRSVLL